VLRSVAAVHWWWRGVSAGLCAGMDVFAEGCVKGSGNGSGGGVEKGLRGVGEGRGGTGKTKAATTAGEKRALSAIAKI